MRYALHRWSLPGVGERSRAISGKPLVSLGECTKKSVLPGRLPVVSAAAVVLGTRFLYFPDKTFLRIAFLRSKAASEGAGWRSTQSDAPRSPRNPRLTISAYADIVAAMKLKEMEKFMQALADETRIRILHLLGGGELCVCDLMRVLREPQSKVSRHLSYLRKAKVVQARKKEMWMYYRLAKAESRTLAAILEAVKGGKTDFDELEADLNEFRKNKSCLVACCK